MAFRLCHSAVLPQTHCWDRQDIAVSCSAGTLTLTGSCQLWGLRSYCDCPRLHIVPTWEALKSAHAQAEPRLDGCGTRKSEQVTQAGAMEPVRAPLVARSRPDQVEKERKRLAVTSESGKGCVRTHVTQIVQKHLRGPGSLQNKWACQSASGPLKLPVRLQCPARAGDSGPPGPD